MEIIINDDNLKFEEVQEKSRKVRAILVDDNNQVLVSYYSEMILLPGGKIEKGETLGQAISRELQEEVGQVYSEDELAYFATLKHFQKNYPIVGKESTKVNRLVETEFFIGKFKGISKKGQSLTEKEKMNGFNLKLIPLEDLEQTVIQNKNNNPRNIFFQEEILTIISLYISYKKSLEENNGEFKFKLSDETMSNIKKMVFDRFGITYEEYIKLDEDERRELMKKHPLKSNELKGGKVRVMIGTGVDSMFIKVPKGTRIMLEDAVIKAGETSEERMKEIDDEIESLILHKHKKM